MATRNCLTATATLLLLLAACGKPNPAAPGQPANATQSASAPAPAPVALTDAQKAALVAELPAAYHSADLANGETKAAVCGACHTLARGGAEMTGPNLWGIFGRKAGADQGFNYSDELKNAGWTWDAGRLDKWLQDPHAILPESKMTYAGMSDPKDRIDVIAYLKVSTSPPPPS